MRFSRLSSVARVIAPGAAITLLTLACSSRSSGDAPKPVVVSLSGASFRTLADPVVGKDFTLQIPVFGGTPPYALHVAKGSALPDGLVANDRGQIAGTPTKAGSYPIDVTIDDAAGASIDVHDTIIVLAAPSAHTSLAIDAPALPTFGQDQDIGYRPHAAGAGQPWTFDVRGLPAGLVFDPATGTISGKTSATGTSSITISAKDAAGNAASGSPITLPLAVLPPQAPSSSAGVENWRILRPDGAPASVTINGGAISQADASEWTVRDNAGTCSYPVPISGQVAGDQWTFSANGGGCNGYMTQCFAQGQATGSGAASGTVTCTTKVPGLPSDTLTGNWTASRQ